MGIKEKLQDLLLASQKSGDKVRLSTIRLLKSAVRYEEDAKGHELDEGEFLAVVSRLIKQRKESIELFKQGKRDDLVKKEEAELKILEEFLPPQLSSEELVKIINEVINEVKADSARDMGKVMKALMPRVKGKADAEVVKDLVLKRLSGSAQSGR